MKGEDKKVFFEYPYRQNQQSFIAEERDNGTNGINRINGKKSLKSPLGYVKI